MKIVILAGGKGTRLAPYTTVFPKPMMPIGGVPILQIIIERLRKFGLVDITLAVGYLAEYIEAFFGKGSKFGVDINYSKEINPLGTAGPLKLIDGLKEGAFLVMNGDLLTGLDFSKLISFHRKKGAIATLAIHGRRVEIDYGTIEVDKKGNLLDYVEKPKIDYQVSMGINVFEPEVLEYIEKGEKIDIPDLIKRLIDNKEKVCCYETIDYWLDIGRHSDYEDALANYEKIKSKL